MVLGRCGLMCPESERLERESTGEIDYYELDEESKGRVRKGGMKTTSSRLAVKVYRRPAAGVNKGNDPELIRDPGTLRNTTEYLIQKVFVPNVLASCDDNHGEGSPESWEDEANQLALKDPADGKTRESLAGLFEFLTNRFRAIRQDFVVQQIPSENAKDYVFCLEMESRIHLLTLYFYQDTSAPRHAFIVKSSMEQVINCLSTLAELYDSNQDCDANRAEMMAYYLLLMMNKTEVVNDLLRRKCTGIMDENLVVLAISVIRAYRSCDYWRLFTLLKQAPFLVRCAVSKAIPPFQARALASFNRSYTAREAIAIEYIHRVLGFGSWEVASNALLACGLDVDMEAKAVRFGNRTTFTTENYTSRTSAWDSLPTYWYDSDYDLAKVLCAISPTL